MGPWDVTNLISHTLAPQPNKKGFHPVLLKPQGNAFPQPPPIAQWEYLCSKCQRQFQKVLFQTKIFFEKERYWEGKRRGVDVGIWRERRKKKLFNHRQTWEGVKLSPEVKSQLYHWLGSTKSQANCTKTSRPLFHYLKNKHQNTICLDCINLKD